MIPFFLILSGNLLCSLALSEHASSVMDVYKQLVPKVMQTEDFKRLFHGRLGLLSKYLCEHCRCIFCYFNAKAN
jgi:hypothetical protein